MRTVNSASKVKLSNPSQTKKLGEILAKETLKSIPGKGALVFGLQGELGSGKTTFLQGFARGLGIKEKILSPTFIIIRKFKIPNPKPQPILRWAGRGFKTFYHIDCYRLEKPKEILGLGFKKIIADPKNIVALEWAEKILSLLPKHTVKIKFKIIGKNIRKIIVADPLPRFNLGEGFGEQGELFQK